MLVRIPHFDTPLLLHTAMLLIKFHSLFWLLGVFPPFDFVLRSDAVVLSALCSSDASRG